MPLLVDALAAASVKSFPQVISDFFPYNDDTQGHNMWSGYFTSRPALKGFVRESSSYLQSARQLQALTGECLIQLLYCINCACSTFCNLEVSSLPFLMLLSFVIVIAGGVSTLGPTNPLFKLERAMGVLQHHDAVSLPYGCYCHSLVDCVCQLLSLAGIALSSRTHILIRPRCYSAGGWY